MTNEEQYAHNKEHLKVFCRGPLKIQGDRLLAINAKRIRCLEERDEEGLADLVLQLSDLLKMNVQPETAEPTMSDWNVALVKLMDARVSCGAEISEMVAAPPYDGEFRTFLCPSCGTEHGYRSAVSGEEIVKRQGVFQDSLAKLVE